MGNIDFGQTIYDSKFKLTSIDQCMNPCRNNIEQIQLKVLRNIKNYSLNLLKK